MERLNRTLLQKLECCVWREIKVMLRYAHRQFEVHEATFRMCANCHKVINLGLELINPVIEPGEVLPNVIGIDLVLAGELRDHHVVGAESTLHQPLALEDLLLHCFEPRLHASSLLGALNITDVKHPLTHLDRLRGL
ncbi:DNA-directed RNA polymerase subunit beta [Hordeum vulgare]|nr:DNA-directed RNA polymerase subunit beta [Hordeum vulgare]